MPETCENWLGFVNVNSYVYYIRQTRESLQVLPYSVNPLSKTVLSNWSFISNKRHVNLWTDSKARK